MVVVTGEKTGGGMNPEPSEVLISTGITVSSGVLMM